MPSRTVVALAACVSLLSAAAILPAAAKAEDEPMFGAAQVGTLGAGVMLGYDFSPSFSARVAVNYFSYGDDESSAGNQYSVDLQLFSLGVLGDWHPFESGFRITAGGLLNGNTFTYASSEESLELGGGGYRGNMQAELGFDALAPYLGIGWTSGRADGRGLSFFADAGVIFQGSPSVSASGQVEEGGSSCSFGLSESGQATVEPGCGLADLAADLEREHAELQGELSDLDIYPVLMLGMVYRF